MQHELAILFLTPGIVLRLIVDHGGPGDSGGGNEAQQQKLHVGLTSQTEHDSHSRPVLKYLIFNRFHIRARIPGYLPILKAMRTNSVKDFVLIRDIFLSQFLERLWISLNLIKSTIVTLRRGLLNFYFIHGRKNNICFLFHWDVS